MRRPRTLGLEVVPLAEGGYGWVFLEREHEGLLHERTVVDECAYETEEAAWVAAYLALRRQLRRSVRLGPAIGGA